MERQAKERHELEGILNYNPYGRDKKYVPKDYSSEVAPVYEPPAPKRKHHQQSPSP